MALMARTVFSQNCASMAIDGTEIRAAAHMDIDIV
jgi:hypothetical protein